MRRLLAGLLFSSWLAAAPAGAEEGLFVARAGGGVATVSPVAPDLGGMATMSMDLCVSERTGVIAGANLVRHHAEDTLGLFLGVKRLLRERQWTRFYLHLGPELLILWPGEGAADRARRTDLALHGGLGFEYLVMWGFGLSFELHGSLPAGLGGRESFDAATAGATGSLFMEF